jgi:hypothetical protein
MRTEKKPQAGRQGAGCGRYEKQHIAFPCHCQLTPIPWLIRAKFIESFLCQRFTRENSLKVDFLLLIAEFLEGAGNGRN